MICHNFTEIDFRDTRTLFLPGSPKNFLKKTLEKNSIFHLHIPKTGGTFLTDVFTKTNLTFHNPSHLKCNAKIPLYPDPTDSVPRPGLFQDQKGFDESLRISVVRNPFEWLVSYYFHSHGIPGLLFDEVKGVGGIRSIYPTFDSFVEAYCDEEKYWPKGLSEFRRFYPFQIFDEAGNCQAHFIFKNANNRELIRAITFTTVAYGYSLRNYPVEVLEALDTKSNVSVAKKKDYREYYSLSQIDMLNRKWKEILSVFGYDFEGSSDAQFIIDSQNLRYSFKENKLWKNNDN